DVESVGVGAGDVERISADRQVVKDDRVAGVGADALDVDGGVATDGDVVSGDAVAGDDGLKASAAVAAGVERAGVEEDAAGAGGGDRAGGVVGPSLISAQDDGGADGQRRSAGLGGNAAGADGQRARGRAGGDSDGRRGRRVHRQALDREVLVEGGGLVGGGEA